MLAVVHDRQWQKFCQLIAREELISDPRTLSVATRKVSEELVEQVTAEWTRTRSTQEVVAALNAESISCSPILNFGEIVREPHFREREMVQEVAHATAGKITHYGTAPKFSQTRTGIRSAAPLLGQHNAEVYGKWLGFDAEKLDELGKVGAI